MECAGSPSCSCSGTTCTCSPHAGSSASPISSTTPRGWELTSSSFSPDSLSPVFSTTRSIAPTTSAASSAAAPFASSLSTTASSSHCCCCPCPSDSTGTATHGCFSLTRRTSGFANHSSSMSPTGSALITSGRLPLKSSTTLCGRSSSGSSRSEEHTSELQSRQYLV